MPHTVYHAREYEAQASDRAKAPPLQILPWNVRPRACAGQGREILYAESSQGVLEIRRLAVRQDERADHEGSKETGTRRIAATAPAVRCERVTRSWRGISGVLRHNHFAGLVFVPLPNY